MQNDSNNISQGRPLFVVSVAIILLLACQFLPWSDMTGGFVSDFNLFEDLAEPLDVKEHATNTGVDLAREIAEAESEETDVTAEEELPVHEIEAPVVEEAESYTPAYVTDNRFLSPRVDGEMVIEDYSPDGTALDRFKAALGRASSENVRIAVIGDSYIEGDLLCQDIRKKLRAVFGGAGVGYVALHSDFPGFRRSVVQSDNGWTNHDIRTSKATAVKTLSGVISTSEPGATVTFKGASSPADLKTWQRSTFIYSSPAAGNVEIRTAAGTQQFAVEPSDRPQAIEVDGSTDFITLSTDVDSLVSYGLWLEGACGITVDCMSIRGYSGLRHRSMSQDIAAAMNPYVDYDLVIVEYGTNAVSEEQTDYTSYSNVMCKAISRIRQCHPGADIIILGVGDRGIKQGSEIVSMPAIKSMTAAQRLTAQKCGVAFWDTYEAMGGEGSIVDWRKRGLVNGDYIHINGKGGAELAGMFVGSLLKAVGVNE